MSWLLPFVLCSAALAETPAPTPKQFYFAKDCHVISKPAEDGTFQCEKKQGESVTKLEYGTNGFWKIIVGDCDGYVEMDCLDVATKQRERIESRKRHRPVREWYVARQVGLGLGLVQSWAKPTSSASYGSGLGYAIELEGIVPLGEGTRVTLIPGIRYLSLSRDVSGAGALIDPSPQSYLQKILFGGIGGLFGYKIEQWVTGPGDGYFWFLEAGFEYYVPLSAKQIDPSGISTGFKSQDKLFLAVFGPTVDVSMSRKISVMGRFQLTYNLGSRGGAQLIGARLVLATNLSL